MSQAAGVKATRVPDISIEIPIRTVSELNVREHHFVRAKRRREQREEVWAEWHGHRLPKDVGLVDCVRLTRIGPRAMDSDAVVASFKAIRDEVARLLGFDDNRGEWVYGQEKGAGIEDYRIRIEVFL